MEAIDELIDNIKADELIPLQEADQKQSSSVIIPTSIPYSDELTEVFNKLNTKTKIASRNLKSLSEFLRSLTKQADVFIFNSMKLIETYDKKVKTDDHGNDMISYWLTSLPEYLRTIFKVLDAHMKYINTNWVDNLDTFNKNYSYKSDIILKEWNRYKGDLKKIEKAQSAYYKTCKKKEEADKEIETSIIDHEKGIISFAQVQK